MTPADVWRLFQPLVASVEAAVRQVIAWVVARFPSLHGFSWHGLPVWLVAAGVVVAGWAVAEALSGLVKLALRLAVLAFVAVVVLRVVL